VNAAAEGDRDAHRRHRARRAVAHTYPMVSQFWTYKADEFLKTPAYDRNYPPVKP
jgi:branched-chain amino acid transport system substrate-binding protein